MIVVRVAAAAVPFAVWAAAAAAGPGWRAAAAAAVVWWVCWVAGHARRRWVGAPAAGLSLIAAAVAAVSAAGAVTALPPWVLPAALAGPAGTWWWAVWRHTAHPDDEPDDDPDSDDPDGEVAPSRPRPVEFAPRGEAVEFAAGVWSGPAGDGSPARPQARRLASLPVIIESLADPDPAHDADPDDGASLAERVAAAWPAKRDGAPLANVHLADLAALIDVPVDELAADITDALGAVEKVTARPLEPDPVTGRKRGPSGRPGLTRASLQAWLDATGVATP